ncbi:MAG: sulfite exporter TauE/SafE family protein [Candidatus Omnitrophota bacterium]
MTDTFITHFQVFFIGFSFGIAGPCFLACTPILAAYIAGSGKKLKEALGDILIFLTGRLLAYLVLGFLAGASGALLKQFIGAPSAVFLKPAGGVVSILFGALILARGKRPSCGCPRGAYGAIYGFGGLFILGFMIGISPCAPLVALLFEITLISRGAMDGALYALSFGLGTFLSGFIVVGSLAGVITWLPAKVLGGEKAGSIFRAACALLLILFGAALVLTSAW